MAGDQSPSPEKPKLSDGSSGSRPREVVGERVKEMSSSLVFPMLSRTNYHEWALVMQVNLEAMGLWGAVESSKVERREDRLALATILRAVPTDMHSGLANKKSAKEAWEAVEKMRLGVKRVKEANTQKLLREFELVAFKEGESIDDFANRLNTLVAKLRELGESMEDVRVVKKFLRVVPPRYHQIAVSIETLLDLDAMSIEELVGRFRAAEDRAGVEEIADRTGQLLLTEEQWEVRRRQRRGKERVRSGDARHGDGDRKGGRSGGHEDDDDDDGGSSVSSGASRRRRNSGNGKCYNCGVRGHFSRECTKPRKEEALLADADEEPALL